MSRANPKDVTAFPQGRRNQDLLQRLNHLYQANTYLESLSNSRIRTTTSLDGGDPIAAGTKGKQKAECHHDPKNLDALGAAVRKSNHRFGVMVKHNILATDPSLKRSFCKGCNTICIPGHNARVRIKPSKIHGNRIITTCLTCSTTRTIPAPPIQVAVNKTVAGLAPSDDDPSAVHSMPQPSDLAVPHSPSEDPTQTHSSRMRPLDGVNRVRKRRKLSRPPQFSRREAVRAGLIKETVAIGTASTATGNDNSAGTNSTRDNDVPSVEVTETPPSTVEIGLDNLPIAARPNQKQQKGQKGQKGQTGQKQKGKNSKGGHYGGPAKQDGHLLWRGDELVVGWGDPIHSAAPSPAPA